MQEYEMDLKLLGGYIEQNGPHQLPSMRSCVPTGESAAATCKERYPIGR